MTAFAGRLTGLAGASRRDLSPAGLFVIVAAPAGAAIGSAKWDWSAGTTAAVALVPMWIVIAQQVFSIRRVHGVWVAAFALVALPQLGHFGEHIGQMAQIHIQDVAAPKAHGAVGTLDIEWVHFIWNTWVLMGVLMLLYRFRDNPWLWASLVIATWHAIEHVAIMLDYWRTGKPGSPGLLSKGGDIGGGLPLIRPDLHFIYNLLMTAPLMMALVYQLRKSREGATRP
jgi:hypothetical protein